MSGFYCLCFGQAHKKTKFLKYKKVNQSVKGIKLRSKEKAQQSGEVNI